MKKIFAFVTIIILMLCPVLSVSANDNFMDEGNNGNYFFFSEFKSRMTSGGSFDFSFSWSMESEWFKPGMTSLRMFISATSDNSYETYYVSLYRVDNTGDTLIDDVKLKANGERQEYKFTDLDMNKFYYLHFSKSLLTGTVSGSGRVYPIKQ